MGVVRVEQLFGVLSTAATGSQSFSGSITSEGVITSAEGFSGSGAFLTNIPVSAIDGNISTQWVLSGNVNYTSGSYQTIITGSLEVLGDVSDVFIVKHVDETQDLLKVMSSGITQFYVHSTAPTASAGYGQMYFTSQSLYLGLE
jgi:hypothetical protein